MGRDLRPDLYLYNRLKGHVSLDSPAAAPLPRCQIAIPSADHDPWIYLLASCPTAPDCFDFDFPLATAMRSCISRSSGPPADGAAAPTALPPAWVDAVPFVPPCRAALALSVRRRRIAQETHPWPSSSGRARQTTNRQTSRWCTRSMMLTSGSSLVRYMTLEGQVQGTSQEPRSPSSQLELAPSLRPSERRVPQVSTKSGSWRKRHRSHRLAALLLLWVAAGTSGCLLRVGPRVRARK